MAKPATLQIRLVVQPTRVFLCHKETRAQNQKTRSDEI